jgi:hypothetical protein
VWYIFVFLDFGGVKVFFFKCTLFTTLLFILFQSLVITGNWMT